MLKSVKDLSPEKIFGIIMRRRWFIIIPFCLSMIAGIYLAIILPRVYSSETLILVEPQKVPINYVKPIVSDDADRINTISQQIMSRSNLEKIIDEFNLYNGEVQKHKFIEDKIELMRNRISIKLIRKKGAEAFSISFKGKSPALVMKITNELSKRFINQNLKIRETQAIMTSEFLNKQMDIKRNELEKIEESYKQYRKKYMGELPEQLETNLRALDRIQNQIDDRQQAIRDIRNQLITLNIEQEAYHIKENENPVSIRSTDDIKSNDSKDYLNLEQLKAELVEYKMRYTNAHPAVVNLENLITKIEAELKSKRLENELQKKLVQENYDKMREEIEIEVALKNTKKLSNEMIDKKISQKNQLRKDIKDIEIEINELNKEIMIYQKRIENTPKREQELLSLKRDYDNINDAYNSLLKRKIEAEIALDMEKNKEGEHFRILDYAQLPEKPISPNMVALFSLTVAVGLGIGFGLIYLFEYFGQSFRSPEEIEALLKIPVAITIPVIDHPKDLIKKKVDTIFSTLFIILSLILFTIFAFLTLIYVDHSHNFLNKFISI
jgi:polysaccharide chain length determinant protein (PEP-CTERM system associated)